MTEFRRLGSSLVGKKLIAAVTGLILLLYLIAHMAGNLKALVGFDAAGVPQIDHYARFLRTVGEPVLPEEFLLWAVRVVLLVAFVVHIVVVTQLVAINRAARPISYAQYRTRASSVAAKSMMVTGLAILVFVVVHVLHLTTGTIRFGPFEEGQVYANLYQSFRRPLVALFYLAMMLGVGVHLVHGGWSMLQTWGLDSPGRNKVFRRATMLLALVIAIGFASLPLLFVFGLLPAPPESSVTGVGPGG
jgi:succinate dehydrogenase / fumarate reductase cytochrome b subunit